MILVKHIRKPRRCSFGIASILSQERVLERSALKNSKQRIHSKVIAINESDLLLNYNQNFFVYAPVKSIFHFPEPSSLLNATKWNLLQFNPRHWLHDKFFSEQTLSKKEKSTPKEDIEKNWGGPEAFRLIIFLKEDINEVLKKHEQILVFFSANWCKHCLGLRKPFGEAAKMAKEADLPVKFATFDVDINQNLAHEKGVVGVPLLKYYKNGQFVSNYKGKRTAEDLFQFVKNPPTSSSEVKKADV